MSYRIPFLAIRNHFNKLVNLIYNNYVCYKGWFKVYSESMLSITLVIRLESLHKKIVLHIKFECVNICVDRNIFQTSLPTNHKKNPKPITLYFHGLWKLGSCLMFLPDIKFDIQNSSVSFFRGIYLETNWSILYVPNSFIIRNPHCNLGI